MMGWIDEVLALDVFDLAQPLDGAVPHRPGTVQFRSFMTTRHGDHVGVDGVSAALDLFLLTGHTGTHVDALGHISANGCVHGGVPAAEEQAGGTLASTGIDRMERFLYRGILLDIPPLRGATHLEGDEAVTARDLEAAAGDAALGDAAVVVRTGWGAEEVYRSSAYDGVEHGMPGIDLEGARFLAERGAAVVGSDTLAVERLPAGRLAGPNAPVHRFMLAERGIHLVENLNLEELAERKIGEFLFVMAPLPIRGGTGSPFRPLALVSS